MRYLFYIGYLLTITTVLFFASCNHEVSPDEGEPLPEEIKGTLYDAAGYPLSKVKIEVGPLTTHSDSSGSFILHSLFADIRAYIVFSKTGYLTVTDTLPANGLFDSLVLLPDVISCSIDVPITVKYVWGPAGWRGDFNALTFSDTNTLYAREEDPDRKHTCFTYTPSKSSRDSGWASVSYIGPSSWMFDPEPKKVISAKKLIFWARGERGNEIVDFKTGYEPGFFQSGDDSYVVEMNNVQLTQKWQRFEFDLSNQDLSVVYHPFTWMAFEKNVVGSVMTVYIDGIRYE